MPERTCVGCRRSRPQAELVRCVLTSDGHAVVSRTAAGRGAWVCATALDDGPDCVQLGLRRRGFERAWRRPVPAAAGDKLASALKAVRDEMTMRKVE